VSPDFDGESFAQELDDLRDRVQADLGPDDLGHLRKIQRWGRLCSALGWAGAWIIPNPISALLLAQGRTTRWAMVAHHVLHRGYDKVPGTPAHLTSKGFAKGPRRFVDWVDWIYPQAWEYEHNQQHHYRLGEEADPDYVEKNLDWLRAARLPTPVKLAIVAFFSATWKWSYYAPNTLRHLRGRSDGRGAERNELEGLASMFATRAFWQRCLAPYAAIQFVLMPLLFAPLGLWAAMSVLCNSLLAEVITNLHCFVIITTNHAGEDLYAFEGRPKNRAEFYLRQVLGSTNFTTGSDGNDFLHGWLNYQIEHHLFPDLPMHQYQKIQPEVRAICERYGVPYVQESVWIRLRKTLAVMVGRRSMRRLSAMDAIEPVGTESVPFPQ
jgi:fatty acid desaturase